MAFIPDMPKSAKTLIQAVLKLLYPLVAQQCAHFSVLQPVIENGCEAGHSLIERDDAKGWFGAFGELAGQLNGFVHFDLLVCAGIG